MFVYPKNFQYSFIVSRVRGGGGGYGRTGDRRLFCQKSKVRTFLFLCSANFSLPRRIHHSAMEDRWREYISAEDHLLKVGFVPDRGVWGQLVRSTHAVRSNQYKNPESCNAIHIFVVLFLPVMCIWSDLQGQVNFGYLDLPPRSGTSQAKPTAAWKDREGFHI